MREFRSPDGTVWIVQVRVPGASNAMVVFRHQDGRTTRQDRYAWYLSSAASASDVTSRLDRKALERSITNDELARLFRRSMLVSAADNPLGIPVTEPAV